MRLGVPVRILAAAAVAAAALVGLVLREGMARAQGQEIKLQIAGYDPRSLLSGHYVQFQIRSDLPAGSPCPRGAERDILATTAGGWVALKRIGDRHVPSGGAQTRAGALKLGDIAVRGTMDCFPALQSGPGAPRQELTSVGLDLGVDRLHVEQKQAEALERDLRDPDAPRDAHVILSIGRDGKARVKGLVVNGRRADLTWM